MLVLIFAKEACITKDLLEKERQNSRNLDDHVHRLQEEVQESAKCVQASRTKEKEMADKHREQVCSCLAETALPTLMSPLVGATTTIHDCVNEYPESRSRATSTPYT